MQPERPALANQAVEQEGAFLGDPIVLDEEFLELIDNQRISADKSGAAHADESRVGIFGYLLSRHAVLAIQVLAIFRDGVDAGLAEQVAAFLEHAIEPLQHAQAEFAFALDGNGTGVWQAVLGIRFEFNALLEVDQVQLDFIRRIVHRQVRDQRVQQRRLARAGLAGDKRVLGRALAQVPAFAAWSLRPGRLPRRCPLRALAAQISSVRGAT